MVQQLYYRSLLPTLIAGMKSHESNKRLSGLACGALVMFGGPLNGSPIMNDYIHDFLSLCSELAQQLGPYVHY